MRRGRSLFCRINTKLDLRDYDDVFQAEPPSYPPLIKEWCRFWSVKPVESRPARVRHVSDAGIDVQDN